MKNRNQKIALDFVFVCFWSVLGLGNRLAVLQSVVFTISWTRTDKRYLCHAVTDPRVIVIFWCFRLACLMIRDYLSVFLNF